MPHLKVKEFKKVPFPASVDDIVFNYLASNIYQQEQLLHVSVDDVSFFLVVKQQQDAILIKSDKTTRPSSVYLLHKALLGYAKLANLDVIASNIPTIDKKNPHLQTTSALKTIDFFAEHFPTDKEVYIEVGFGSGRHLLYQAKQNPDKLLIGLEIHRPSIEQVLKQINIQSLDNIYLLDYDARLFLEQVPSNIVGKIFVHFPVPWDKKPHRRIISRSFIAEAQRALKVGGRLELRTDSENYYAYSYETFMSFTKMELEIKKNKDIAISSKYEDRWKKLNKNIYDITMINDIDSPKLEIKGNFLFKKQFIDEAVIKELHNTKVVKEDYFIHFERVYRIENGGYLLKLSFGSFDRPEHLYLYIKDDIVSYIPHMPLRSKANLLAHQEILKGLYG